MIERGSFADNSAIITSSAHKVRAVLDGEETVFSATDILAACGAKSAGKVARNCVLRGENVPMRKLAYPMMTRMGRREFRMNFVTAKTARELMKKASCSPEVKKWLLTEVLTFRFTPEESGADPAAADDAHAYKPEPVSIEPDVNAKNPSEMERRVDDIIFELLELKKAVRMAAS